MPGTRVLRREGLIRKFENTPMAKMEPKGPRTPCGEVGLCLESFKPPQALKREAQMKKIPEKAKPDQKLKFY
jgi:hypothetical protein